MESEKRYIGDGVYASYDGYHIWLRTQRENGWAEIALEPSVLNALVDYARNLRNQQDGNNGSV